MSLDARQARESFKDVPPTRDEAESGADLLFITSLALSLTTDARRNIQLIRALKPEKQACALGWLRALQEGKDSSQNPYASIARNVNTEALAALVKKVEDPEFFKKAR